MALFNSNDLKKSIDKHDNTGAISIPVKVFFWNKQQKNIGEALDKHDFLPGHLISFTSDGAWNMHDLVYYLLKRFGSGKVYLSTWAISEIAMRQLFHYKNEGMITELYMLCDYRNTSRKPAELSFISLHATKIKLAKVHAKVTVIETPTHSISINGSPNYTRNPRLESGDILVSSEVAEHHKKWLLNEILDGEQNQTD